MSAEVLSILPSLETKLSELEPTMILRWYAKKQGHGPVLQQLWKKDNIQEWRDIPLELESINFDHVS